MKRSQIVAVENAKGLRKFLLQKFSEQNESPRDFVNNSDYGRNAVDMVVSGHYASSRIRRDMARYLGRKDWQELIEEFKREVGT